MQTEGPPPLVLHSELALGQPGLLSETRNNKTPKRLGAEEARRLIDGSVFPLLAEAGIAAPSASL